MIEIAVKNAAGVIQGAGPIPALSWEREARLDEIGSVAAGFPAAAPNLDLLAHKAILSATGQEYPGAPWTAQGDGIIETIGKDSRGKINSVGGFDLLSELKRDLAFNTLLSDGAGGPMAAVNILPAIGALTSGWTFSGTPSKAVYYQFKDETVFEMLRKVAELTGDHFRLGAGRTVEWLTAFDDSGLRATGEGDPRLIQQDLSLCLIGDGVKLTSASADIFTWSYPRGGGNDDARLTLYYCTRNGAPGGVPGDYTSGDYLLHIDADPYKCYVKRISTDILYGRIRKAPAYSDIAPQSDGDTQAAANQLYDKAVEELSRAGELSYTLDMPLVGVQRALKPGQTLYISFHDLVQIPDENGNIIARRWIDIEGPYLILSPKVRVEGAQGLRTTSVQITTLTRDEWPKTAGAVLAQQVQRLAVQSAHRQKAADMVAATTTRRGAVAIDTSTGLSISGAGVLSWAGLAGPGGGGGTAGYLAYWSGASTLGNSGLYYDAANSRLGFGTNAPSYPVHVTSTQTDVNSSVFGIYSTHTMGLTANKASADLRGLQAVANSTTSAFTASGIYGARVVAQMQGTATSGAGNQLTDVYGLRGTAQNISASSGDVGNYYGVRGDVSLAGPGSVTNMRGLYGMVAITGGTNAAVVGNMAALETSFSHAGSGTVTAGYGVKVGSPGGTGPITTAYGVFIPNQGRSGITTSYGMRIDAQSLAGTVYALYVGGGQSYHAGNFGIGGATTPGALLHVKGSSNVIQSIFQANGTQTANVTEWQSSGGTMVLGVSGAGALAGTSTINLTGTGTSSVGGNFGIGVSSLQSWNSSYRAVEINGFNAYMGTSGEFYTLQNAVYTSTGWKYSSAGPATNYYQVNGVHGFRVAASGSAGGSIGWVAALVLDNSGTNATFGGGITLGDPGNIILGTTTGTKIGTSTSQKLSFYNATPVVRQTLAANASDLATAITLVNDIKAKLNTVGLFG